MMLEHPHGSCAKVLMGLESLADCSDDEIRLLEPLATAISFPSGAVIFSEGDQHDQLYFLVSGRVRLEMQSAHYDRNRILSMGRGDLLAWSALVGDSIMTTSAIAEVETEAVSFPGNALNALLEQQPTLGHHFMRGVAKCLSRRLLATRLQLLDLYNGRT